MPAKSQAQQRAAGMALAIKRGEMPMHKAKGAAKEMAASMSQKQVNEYARKRTK